MPTPASNPFNSERLRPGVLEYIFSPSDCLEDFVERLRENGWRGQIIGPHGTGKSTLVQTLIPRLLALGFELELGIFQGGTLRWSEQSPDQFDRESKEVKRRMVIIDGFEQLLPLARWRWRLATRLRGQGLVITAHRSMGLPDLARTKVSLEMAQQIVERLAEAGASAPRPQEVNAAYHARQGNMRDVLFSLYDAHEARQLAARSDAPL